MKQHISKEEYEALPMKARIAWHTWEDRQGRLVSLPNIGTMIEFLDEHTRDEEYFSIRMGRATKGFAFPEGTLITHMDGVDIEIEDEPVLCDALWQVCKVILETKTHPIKK